MPNIDNAVINESPLAFTPIIRIDNNIITIGKYVIRIIKSSSTSFNLVTSILRASTSGGSVTTAARSLMCTALAFHKNNGSII